MNTELKITRSKDIFDSKTVAYVWLETNGFEYKAGEFVEARYYTNRATNQIDYILALGTDDGKYRIVETEGMDVVCDILYEEEIDISLTTNGERYLCIHNFTTGNHWALEKISNNRKYYTPLNRDYIFKNLNDGLRYFYTFSTDTLKCETGYVTSSEVNTIINQSINALSEVKITVCKFNNIGYNSLIVGTNEFGTTGDNNLEIELRATFGNNYITLDETNVTIFNEDLEYECSIEKSSIDPNVFVILDEFTETTNFKITVTHNNTTCTYPLKLQFYHKVKCRTVPSGLDNQAIINIVRNQESNNYWTGESPFFTNYSLGYWVDEYSIDTESLVFATPESCPEIIHVFDDNGLDYIDSYTVIEGVLMHEGDSETWRIYYKSSGVRIINFKQLFTYND